MTSENYLIINCPHCSELTMIFKKDLNCGVFRHAIYKDTFLCVDPHLPKNLCDMLFKERKIFGCGKPFKINYVNDEYIVLVCDYI